MTPGRLALFVALVGAAAVVVYGLFLDRTGSTIALTVAGLAVLVVVLLRHVRPGTEPPAEHTAAQPAFEGERADDQPALAGSARRGG